MINYSIYKSVESLPKEWDNLVEHDIFLQTNYLRALEKAAPDNISFYCVGLYKNKTLIGVAIIQRVELYLNDIFRNKNDSCFKERFKNIISKVLKGNILVLGNLTHTGQHGLYLDQSQATYLEFLECILNSIDELKLIIKSKYNKTIRAFLLKDYFLDDSLMSHNEFIESLGFSELKVQPNMMMTIKNHWNSFDDYMSDLHKKYRDRYKSARKKSKLIAKKELLVKDLEEVSDDLYQLYMNVSDHAKINTFILPNNHFFEFKKELGDAFKIFGYYLDEKIVGFYTLIINNNQLETYFLGYDSEHQYKHQLYLNMLYDMAEYGINHNFDNIVYARTAMEIKSSVGAKPNNMVMYLKHSNWLLNTLLKKIFKLMNPSQSWEERHPFK